MLKSIQFIKQKTILFNKLNILELGNRSKQSPKGELERSWRGWEAARTNSSLGMLIERFELAVYALKG